MNNKQNLVLALFGLFACFSIHAKSKQPNILFAISDDQSYAHTSFAGSSFINTPAFDKVASEGVYFSNCYAGSPGCAPSRSSIVTGRYPWQNEQSGQHASSWMKKYVPFVDELANNGYAVGRTGKGVDPFRYAQSEKDSLWRTDNAAGPVHSEIAYTPENDERFAKGILNLNYAANFEYFMENVRGDKPFFFWFGAKEPHRGYEKDSWKKRNKKLSDVTVPEFLPDNPVVRGDLLDYSIVIEWFDLHLHRMLKYLEKIGELENTIVIVTSDNGMPFPRAKANTYNYGAHVPLAIRYPKQFKQNITVNSPASFIDIAPTLLQIADIKPIQMQAITGKSMVKALKKGRGGRNQAFSGRERHSYSRFNNMGYPQRAIRKDAYLLIWNLKPDRWPAGAPQTYVSKTSDELLPLYKGAVFTDIDGSPSKSSVINGQTCCGTHVFFRWATDKRPEFELFNLVKDPDCLFNQYEKKDFQKVAMKLKNELLKELTKTKDPRVVGPDKEIFDSYIRYSSKRRFPAPN